MQINGKQINDGSIDFDKIVTGDGVVLDVNGSTVTGLPTPVNKSDAVNKAYVDALSSESSYCELVDKVTQLPINSYTKTAGVRVLSTNTSSPGIYEYNAASGKWVKTYDWTMVTSTVPSATLIPSAEDTSVYVAQITSATNVTFAKLPQEQASYVFSNGITALQEGDSTKVSIDYSKVASVSSVTSLANTVNGKQNKLTASNAGDGIKITGNQVIGINQRTQADGGSGAITFTNGKVDIQYASYDKPGILTADDYTRFSNTTEGAQSDWNENDENSSSHVKNRTHYIIPVVLSTDNYDLQTNEIHQYSGITLTNGTTYRLVFSSGISYDATLESNTATFLEGISLMFTDDAAFLKNTSSEKISISGLYDVTNGEIKQLDANYIPVDDATIFVNDEGKLSSMGGGSSVFTTDKIITVPVGVYEEKDIKDGGGSVTIHTKGKTMEQVWDMLYVKETDPIVTLPTITVSGSVASKEVGTTGTSNISITFNKGSYTYGPTSTSNATSYSSTYNGTIYTTSSFQITYNVGTSASTVNVSVPYSADTVIPVTNMGTAKPEKAIQAGTATGTATIAAGYRNLFYGYSTAESIADINSTLVRSLTGIKDGKQTLPVLSENTSAKSIVVATPHSSSRTLSVVMPSSSRADVTSQFEKQTTVNVEGANGFQAISYDIWIYKPATMDGTYEITIK